jgi:hypothetical protein
MQRMTNHLPERDSSPPHRRYMLKCYIVLVLIWTVGGMLVWSGDVKPWFLASPVWMKLVFVNFDFLTWPAHEATLYFTGKGLGSNALLELSVSSLSAFFIWSCILWGPVLSLRWRKIPAWFGAIALVLLVLLTFALFWKYGNG